MTFQLTLKMTTSQAPKRHSPTLTIASQEEMTGRNDMYRDSNRSYPDAMEIKKTILPNIRSWLVPQQMKKHFSDPKFHVFQNARFSLPVLVRILNVGNLVERSILKGLKGWQTTHSIYLFLQCYRRRG